PQWDLTEWILSINEFKAANTLLCEEGNWHVLTPYHSDIIFLEKTSDKGNDPLRVLVNKDWHKRRLVHSSEFPDGQGQYKSMVRLCGNPRRMEKIGNSIELGKFEIVAFV
ncbi:MAG: hypothetical protein PHC61_18610, partial [Chitinivibrionales bacterium]|nr:hypothetical protein [Chitinivibrionales bacterium]